MIRTYTEDSLMEIAAKYPKSRRNCPAPKKLYDELVSFRDVAVTDGVVNT